MNSMAAPRLIWLAEAQHHAFMVRRYREPSLHFVWHYHPEMELVWVRRGRGLRYVGNSIEPFRNGDLCLLGGNLPHVWGSAPEQPGAADWAVMQFRPALWGEAFWKLPELRGVAEMLRLAEFGLHFTGPRAGRVGRLLEQLAEQPPHTAASLILALEILRRLQRDCRARLLHGKDDPLPQSAADGRLHEVLAHIKAHAVEALTEAEAARRTGMSPAAFSRWFKRNVGHTFQRHLNLVRVARVCLQLATSESTITDIALACGFNNLANFNRRFREITGRTPRQYRADLRHMETAAAPGYVVRLGQHGAHRVPPAVG